MTPPRTLAGRGIVHGRASGPALVSAEAVSFLGDIDINTGIVVGRLPSVQGQCVRGTVFFMPDSMGSAGAWRFLYQLYVHENHPAAIVSVHLPDPSLVQGAILANIPVLCGIGPQCLQSIENGTSVTVDGHAGTVEIHARSAREMI